MFHQNSVPNISQAQSSAIPPVTKEQLPLPKMEKQKSGAFVENSLLRNYCEAQLQAGHDFDFDVYFSTDYLLLRHSHMYVYYNNKATK